MSVVFQALTSTTTEVHWPAPAEAGFANKNFQVVLRGDRDGSPSLGEFKLVLDVQTVSGEDWPGLIDLNGNYKITIEDA